MKALFYLTTLAFFLVVSIWLFKFIQEKRRRQSRYQGLLQQLVIKMGSIETIFSKLKVLVELVDSERLLSKYESMVFSFERLLQQMAEIPRFGEDVRSLRQSFFVVDRFEVKANILFREVAEVVKGKGGCSERPAFEVEGCYFCSKPLPVKFLKPVPLKVAGIKIKVAGCDWCFEEIRTRGKTKVLYFSYGEEAVHWSKVSHYDPERDFWKMDGSGVLDGRKLKYISSAANQDE